MRLSDILANPHTFDPETLGFLRQLVDDSPYCQPARMLYAKALINIDKVRFESEVKRAMAAAPNRRMLRAYLSEKPADTGTRKNTPAETSIADGVTITKEQEIFSVETATRPSGEERRRRQQSIIDRFIKEEPRIQPAKSSVPDGEIARESLEDKPDLVSETLAEVLLKQGKKERAIVIYKKLCLMFPEKSSYFAKKLESIQKEEY